MHQIFDQLDAQGIDAIDPQTLIAHYDADRHPEVLSRLKSADEVMKEFLDTFDVGGSSPGMVTREEFVLYYTNVSAASCCGGDDGDDGGEEYFETVLRSVWHLNPNRGGGRGAAADAYAGKATSCNQSGVASRLRQAQTTDARARATSPAAVMRRPSSANGE